MKIAEIFSLGCGSGGYGHEGGYGSERHERHGNYYRSSYYGSHNGYHNEYHYDRHYGRGLLGILG